MRQMLLIYVKLRVINFGQRKIEHDPLDMVRLLLSPDSKLIKMFLL